MKTLLVAITILTSAGKPIPGAWVEVAWFHFYDESASGICHVFYVELITQHPFTHPIVVTKDGYTLVTGSFTADKSHTDFTFMIGE